MDFQPSQKSQDFLDRLRAFMDQHVYPFEREYVNYHKINNPGGQWENWTEHPGLEALKSKAKKAGLWNLFLPDEELGQD